MNNNPFILLVLIICNERDWLSNCLESLLSTDYDNFKIIVIDNASNDASASFIANNFKNIEIVKNRINVGFSGAVNKAFRIANRNKAKYVTILNPDIKVYPDWLSELVKVAEEDEKIGISMPLHYNYSGEQFDDNLSKLLYKNEQFSVDINIGNLKQKYEVISAIGGCMMVRTNMLKKVGLMDPIYFLYAEDSDFARRVIFHGYKIVVAINSKVMHWHRILHKEKLNKKAGFLLFRNQFIYFLKDPNKTFFGNLIQYYFDKENGMWKMVKSWADISIGNWRYLILVIYVQLWIFLHLPIIFIRQVFDRKIKY